MTTNTHNGRWSHRLGWVLAVPGVDTCTASSVSPAGW